MIYPIGPMSGTPITPCRSVGYARAPSVSGSIPMAKPGHSFLVPNLETTWAGAAAERKLRQGDQSESRNKYPQADEAEISVSSRQSGVLLALSSMRSSASGH